MPDGDFIKKLASKLGSFKEEPNGVKKGPSFFPDLSSSDEPTGTVEKQKPDDKSDISIQIHTLGILRNELRRIKCQLKKNYKIVKNLDGFDIKDITVHCPNLEELNGMLPLDKTAAGIHQPTIMAVFAIKDKFTDRIKSDMNLEAKFFRHLRKGSNPDDPNAYIDKCAIAIKTIKPQEMEDIANSIEDEENLTAPTTLDQEQEMDEEQSIITPEDAPGQEEITDLPL